MTEFINEFTCLPTPHEVNVLHDDSYTWLGLAVCSRDVNTVRHLLYLGANCNINSEVYDTDRRISRWESPLITASRLGCDEIVEILVECGASVNAKDLTTGRSPLHWACTKKHERIARYLVAEGSLVNSTNIDGETPIVEAIVHRKTTLVDLFIQSGLLLDTPINYDRDTVLMLAAHVRLYPAAIALLKAGARVDWFNRDYEDLLAILLRDSGSHHIGCRDPDVQDYQDTLIQMTVYAGAKVRSDHWDYCHRSSEVTKLLDNLCHHPLSLACLCRLTVRNELAKVSQQKTILTCVNMLPVPHYLKQYLGFDIV